MSRRRSFRRKSALRRFAMPFVMALCLFIASPGIIGAQDVASLLMRGFDPDQRWAITLGQAPGGETTFITDRLGDMKNAATVTIGGGSVVIEGVDPVVTGALDASALVPDEERIDRSWKGDLPVTITTPATSRGFSAGSIMEEHSRLAPPDPDKLPQVAFTSSTQPLSALALNRFISPKAPEVMVADLEPAPPLPHARPDQTMLVEASYPTREFQPSAANQAAEAMLAAYAPGASVVPQDMFDALFTTPREKPDEPVATVNPGDHWWAANPLPPVIYTDPEQECLAEGVYFEARGESYEGQLAVAQVILNRVKNPAYPNTICGVVYQNKTWRDACQFSFACDGIADIVIPGRAWNTAKRVAEDITFKGAWNDEVGTATHYHATYVNPPWAKVFTKKAKIGLHVFYQTRYGGWS